MDLLLVDSQPKELSAADLVSATAATPPSKEGEEWQHARWQCAVAGRWHSHGNGIKCRANCVTTILVHSILVIAICASQVTRSRPRLFTQIA
jgi:hypothetical protein